MEMLNEKLNELNANFERPYWLPLTVEAGLTVAEVSCLFRHYQSSVIGYH
jgi:hypothetical protein